MIALVDKRCASAGYEFVYLGMGEDCVDCGLRLPCHHNLEEGRRYVVTAVRDNVHPCSLFGEVIVCEVEESFIDVAMDPKKAFKGASIVFNPLSCEEVLCGFAGYCMPEGLKDGDRCTIEAVKREVRCDKNGRVLVIAGVRKT